jgi:hypothetical protein
MIVFFYYWGFFNDDLITSEHHKICVILIHYFIPWYLEIAIALALTNLVVFKCGACILLSSAWFLAQTLYSSQEPSLPNSSLLEKINHLIGFDVSVIIHRKHLTYNNASEIQSDSSEKKDFHELKRSLRHLKIGTAFIFMDIFLLGLLGIFCLLLGSKVKVLPVILLLFEFFLFLLLYLILQKSLPFLFVFLFFFLGILTCLFSLNLLGWLWVQNRLRLLLLCLAWPCLFEFFWIGLICLVLRFYFFELLETFRFLFVVLALFQILWFLRLHS